MRNPAIAALEVLIGEWSITLSNAWFLDSLETRQHGRATGRWLGEAFIEFEAEMEGVPTWHFVFGRSDAEEQSFALYHDPRPTSRVFRMSFDGTEWRLARHDPDFYQRFIATVAPDRIEGRWEASDDQGATWRKDFDLVFERADRGPQVVPAEGGG
ncbi:MAG: hypothetical protein ACRDJU_02910 [Actinomycetota bacterium]